MPDELVGWYNYLVPCFGLNSISSDYLKKKKKKRGGGGGGGMEGKWWVVVVGGLPYSSVQ